MASFGDDGISVAVGNDVVLETPAQVQAQFPGSTITPTANFNFSYNGTVQSYLYGDTAVVTPDLLAALSAAGAPFSQP